jgi:hypothetical protein
LSKKINNTYISIENVLALAAKVSPSALAYHVDRRTPSLSLKKLENPMSVMIFYTQKCLYLPNGMPTFEDKTFENVIFWGQSFGELPKESHQRLNCLTPNGLYLIPKKQA